ncbi:hypothetical protein LP418_20345 [Nocardioides sp. B-3]|nr:hypothetical protein [Nocardioides sp. B-3]UUZ58502.1 hypothetical protein LP418_20345 [Nocardioides sp. B-3]
MHRPTLMLDSGAYRNAPVDAMHNIITNDGRDPAEFRSIVRAELAAYGDVEIRDVAATTVERLGDGTFEVTLAEGSVVTAGEHRARDRAARRDAGHPRLRRAVGADRARVPVLPRPRAQRQARRHPGLAQRRARGGDALGDRGVDQGGAAGDAGGTLGGRSRGHLGLHDGRRGRTLRAPHLRAGSPLRRSARPRAAREWRRRDRPLRPHQRPGRVRRRRPAHVAELPMPMPSVLAAAYAGQLAGAMVVREALMEPAGN